MLRPLLALMVAAAALVTGAVLLADHGSTQPSRPLLSTPVPIPTEKYTPEYVSELSERIAKTEIARNHAAADSLIDAHVSAANIRRSKSTADRIDGPLTLNEARRVADRLVVGRVRAQYLGWGDFEIPEIDVDVPYLISVIGTTDGHFVHVAQPTGVVDDIHGLRLTYLSGEPLLERGERYALLTQKRDHPDAYVIIRGHSYALAGRDTVVPLTRFVRGSTEGSAPLSSLELR